MEAPAATVWGSQPFAGLRVLDLSESIAGQYCSRLMAEHGAGVTLIEPLAGSQVRRQPPFDRACPERVGGSLLFWHLNTGKQSVALDTELAEGAAAVAALARHAVVAVVASGRQRDLVRQAHSAITCCLITDFGETGPYAGWLGNELIHQAFGGTMHTTGEREGEPLYGLGHRASYATGVLAYVAVTAALYRREAGGEAGAGEDVELTVTGTAAAMSQNLSTVYFYNGSMPSRGTYPGLLARIRCLDDWVVVFALRHWRELCAAFDVPELADDPDFVDRGARFANWSRAVEVFSRQAATRSADEIVRSAQAGRACVERMHTLRDVVDSEHFRARGFWRSVPTPAGPRPLLGPVFRMSVTDRYVTAGAPELGAHTDAALRRTGLGDREIDVLCHVGATLASPPAAVEQGA